MPQPLKQPTRNFASDNNAGVHPEVLEAIARANQGHVVAYGDDPYTRSAIAKFEEHFGAGIDVFFTFNGTGANVLELAVAEPAVSRRAVQRVRAHLYGRMRRAGKAYGMQADSAAASGWEDHARLGAARLSRDRRPASRAGAGHLDHAVDRDGDGLPAGRDPGAGRLCARARNVSAHGRRAHCQCRRHSGPDAAAGDARPGRGRALVRRNEERNHGRRSGRVFQSQARARIFSICASKGCNWRRRCASSRRSSRRC